MPGKILVADDDNEIIELLKCVLESSGYSVVSVMHGGKLPDLVKQEKPDLIILDVLLPGLDGYSLQLQLSQDEETNSVPVIVLTALPASRSLFEKFQQVKCFMSKPFETEKLLSEVKKVLV